MHEKFDRIPYQLRLSFIAEYQQAVILIEPQVPITDCADPKDNKFLSLAVSGKAPLILSDDDHLLRLHPFRDIISPKKYLERKQTT